MKEYVIKSQMATLTKEEQKEQDLVVKLSGLMFIAGFVLALGVGGIVPVAFNGCIIVFEMFIALLQAFIYTVLSCIYLSDAIHSH